MGDDGGGSLVSPDGVATIQIVGVSASVIFLCTIKSRRSFLLAPANPGSSGKMAVKWLSVVCQMLWPQQAASSTTTTDWKLLGYFEGIQR